MGAQSCLPGLQRGRCDFKPSAPPQEQVVPPLFPSIRRDTASSTETADRMEVASGFR